MKIKALTIAFICSLLFYSCEDVILQEKYQNNPTDNFEFFWNEFDQFYGAFEAKDIKWDSLKLVYGKGIDENSTDEELFLALCGLLNELNDGHADLFSPEQGYFRSWNRREKSYFNDVQSYDFGRIGSLQGKIRSNYLRGKFESEIHSEWLFFWGTIPCNSLNIGYICIPTFSLNEYPIDFIQTAVDSFNQMDAVIIDIRYNGGGTTQAFVSTLNSFAHEKTCYMKSQFRNGHKHTDFTKIEEHWTTPHNDCLRNVPVAVLMNSFSASSSDHFIMGMKTQPNVITVGDTTCGAFSAVYNRVLPNGWKFRMVSQVVYNANGKLLCDENGIYLEGIGIAPDYYVPDSWAPIVNGKDVVLDKALKELQHIIQ